MEEIKKKVEELWELVKEVPQECKGDTLAARVNRMQYMKIRSGISSLLLEIR